MKYIKYLFILFAVVVMGYLILGEIFLPKDTPDRGYVCQEFNDNWQIIHQDGTKENIKIPGNWKGSVVLERKLPEQLGEGISCICFRGSAIKIYIGDELRFSYDTGDTRLFGNHSAEAFSMAFIESRDGGKTVRVEMENNPGILYPIYIGDRMGIWKFLFIRYGAELLIAILTLVLGIISVIASSVLHLIYKKGMALEYLGWGVIFAALWLITNSVFRQLIFPGISVVGDITFLIIALMPFPFILYMNEIQKQRYKKMYLAVCVMDMISAISCITLYVTGIMELNRSFKAMAVCCLLSIVALAFSLVADEVRKITKDYWMEAVGLLVLFVMAAYQILSYFRRVKVFSGVPLAMGLIIMLLFAVVSTIKNVISLEKQKHAAIQASEAKGQFLANMSHEIRTPINSVLGMNEMILRESSESNIREYAMDIQLAGQSLLSLVNDILDFSKIEAGRMELVPVNYDFSVLLHDLMNLMEVKAKEKQLKIEYNIEKDLPVGLYGDDVRIRQILINILDNGVKYTEKGSVVLSVTGEVQEDEVVLHFSVKDTGIGIKEEDRIRLFSAFERLEEKKNRNIEGTGLGMSITMKLLRLMGSELQVESTYGKGSVFSFDLRQKITDDTPIGDMEKRFHKAAKDYHYEVIFTAPEANVLLVDDNAMNRKVFSFLLRKTEIHVDEAQGGRECLEMVCKNRYDIIFLDHMMPDMDGIETFHQLKQIEGNISKDAVIIALTANAVSGARELYLSEGFDDFLTKPVVPEYLEKMIQKYLPKEKVVETKKIVNEE